MVSMASHYAILQNAVSLQKCSYLRSSQGGGGGGYSDIFYIQYIGWADFLFFFSFFFLGGGGGSKFLISIYFWGFQEK